MRRSARLTLILAAFVGIAGLSTDVLAQIYDFHAPVAKKGVLEFESLNGFNPVMPSSGAIVDRSHHELKLNYGWTDWWQMTGFLGISNPADTDPRASVVGLENVFVLKPLKGNGLGVGWFAGMEVATEASAQNVLISGPIVELRQDRLSFLVNPYLERSFGRNHDGGVGLSYLWQGKLSLDKTWAIGIEGYGKIEDVFGAPAWAEQDHRVGPALYLDIDTGGAGPIGVDLGVYFGLTDQSPGTSLKLNIGVPIASR